MFAQLQNHKMFSKKCKICDENLEKTKKYLVVDVGEILCVPVVKIDEGQTEIPVLGLPEIRFLACNLVIYLPMRR